MSSRKHRGVFWRRAVHLGRRLDDEPLNAGSLLAGCEQLHGADDVDFLHRRPPADAAGRCDDAEVDDCVDALGRDHLGDDGIADVGSDEVHVAEVVPRRDDIDTHHEVDVGIGCDPTGKAPADLSAYASNEHGAAGATHCCGGLTYLDGVAGCESS